MGEAETVIDWFLRGRMNYLGEGVPIYVEKGVLYSYGPHFPLALWKEGEVYVTRDKTTNTTARQRHKLIDALVEERKKWRYASLKEMEE